MHGLKHQLYLLGQPSESFDIWSAILLDLYCIVLKSLVMKLGPGLLKAESK